MELKFGIVVSLLVFPCVCIVVCSVFWPINANYVANVRYYCQSGKVKRSPDIIIYINYCVMLSYITYHISHIRLPAYVLWHSVQLLVKTNNMFCYKKESSLSLLLFLLCLIVF